MSQANNPSPHDFMVDPIAFQAQFDREISLCMLGQPNRAREWSMVKCEVMLVAAERLVASEIDTDITLSAPLTVEQTAIINQQIALGRALLETLGDLRAKLIHPTSGHLFDTVAALAFMMGMAAQEVAPRTQELIAVHGPAMALKARRSEVAKRTNEVRTRWISEWLPSAGAFLRGYTGTQTLTAKAAKFSEKFPKSKLSQKQIKKLLSEAEGKDLDTTLDSPTSTNGC